MALKKTHIFWAGFVAILGVIVTAIVMRLADIATAGLTAFVWLLGLGLGTSLGHSVQRSAFFKPELHETDKPKGGE